MGCGTSRQELLSDSADTGSTLTTSNHVSHHHLVNTVTDRDIHETYDFTGPVLGKGSFATVLRIRDRMSGSEYAVKQIDLDALADSPSALNMIERECRTMMALSHPNIVRLQEVYRPASGGKMYLVLDRLEGGSVDGLWREQGKLTEDHAAHIILQVVSAVRYCHDRGIVHRDLKMENSLFEDSSMVPIVKVIDFGLCAELKDGMTSRAFVGTVLYTAPEVLKVEGHGPACDMWSVGVMAYALVAGEFPWYSTSRDVCGQMIKYSDLKFPQEKWKDVSPLCRDFIERCLVKKPKGRITAAQAQRHPWLRRAARAMEGAPLSKGAMRAMLNYQNGNAFKRIVMELVAYSYEPAQIKDLELDFLKMDKRGEGEISLEEFRDALLERWHTMENSVSVMPQSHDKIDQGMIGDQERHDPKTFTDDNDDDDDDDNDSSREFRPAFAVSSTPPAPAPAAATIAAAANHAPPLETYTSTSTSTPNPNPNHYHNSHTQTEAGGSARDGPCPGPDPGPGVKAAAPTVATPPPAAVGGSGVDQDALHAALVMAQAEASLSRAALERKLWSRRRSQLILSESSSALEESACGGGGGGRGGGAGGAGGAAAAVWGRWGGGRASRGMDASGRYREPDEEERTRRTASMDEKKVEEIFRAMDHDHSGSITFTDFVAGCLVEKQVGEAALRTAFDRLDHDRSGLISLDDVHLYLGEDFMEEEMARNMRAISTRDDGQVSYDDFKKCLLGGALPNSRVTTPAISRSASFRALSVLVSSADNDKEVSGEETPQTYLEVEEKMVLSELQTL